jgi:hypothetical protein
MPLGPSSPVRHHQIKIVHPAARNELLGAIEHIMVAIAPGGG